MRGSNEIASQLKNNFWILSSMRELQEICFAYECLRNNV